MKRIKMLHLVPTLALFTVCFSPVAFAQAPPPAPAAPSAAITPPPAAPAAAARKPQAAPKASSQVTVTRSGGCVTVKVCPGPRCAAKAAPAPVPAAPPAAPRATRAAPTKMVCMPASAYNAARRVPTVKKVQRKPLTDPANTRLAVSNTAEVLGHGDWEVSFKQLVGLYELSVGLGNRFQLSFKTSPITWFLPGMPFKEALWAGEVRAQIVRRRLFKLTADATYFHVAGVHGLKLGMSMKYGNDKLAVHAGVGTVLLFPPKMTSYSTCGGPVVREDGSYDESYECSGGSSYGDDNTPVAIITANFGLEARFWRYGKFFLDAFVVHFPGAGAEGTVFSALPGVRFHGKGFAADLGLGIFGFGDVKIPMPVLNLSYRW